MNSEIDSRGVLPAVITPDWNIPPPGVCVISTTRHGGVSDAPYESMNLGLHSGDDVESVQSNRRALEADFCLPRSPHWLNQVHGIDVLELPADANTADGSVTAEKGVVVAVLTADCLPVVIAAADGSRVAVVHAGWRGLASGIIGSAMAFFDQQIPCVAWLGPAIGPAAFEVGEDVRDVFVARNPGFQTAFVAREQNGKYLCDLYSIARADLQNLGVSDVAGGTYCTCSNGRDFHSHRRDGAASGRMATMAWLY